MDEMNNGRIVDVKFSNGFELKGVRDLGGIWITEAKVRATDLAGGLRRVEVTDRETGVTNIMCDLWLESCAELADGSGTSIMVRELGYFERQSLKLKSDVEYLAMMTGVEL